MRWSNKLKLSFVVFALILALSVGSVNAQQVIIPPYSLNPKGTGQNLKANSFLVYSQASTGVPNTIYHAITNRYRNGIIVSSIRSSSSIIHVGRSDLPNLYDLLHFGGTIELAMRVGEKGSTIHTVTSDSDATAAVDNQKGISAKRAAEFAYRLLISEVMWGLDRYLPAPYSVSPQWIEIYNNGGDLKEETDLAAFTNKDLVILIFTLNRRLDRVGQKIEIPNLPFTLGGTITPADTLHAGETFVVVDMVSTINRFGVPWTLKGNSGNTVALRSDDGSETPPTNIVSMYRKISLDGGKYKKKSDVTINGLKLTNGLDGLGHGAEAGSWETSVGRVNMTGHFVGSPGAVQQAFGGTVTSAKTPASLPVGSVIINEIFNSETLQWVELHNTGSSEVNVKNYELDAVHGNKKVQRVFAVPDKDTKIPPGGFLLITNRDPTNSVLAGGVDLHDTDNNKFKAGAGHLYIVIPKDTNNKWMLEKDFLLLLRNGTDKDNHEKVVDMAGNFFIKLVGDTLRTDVWPLVGWTVPGDIDKNDWGGDKGSLARNPGKTYARIDQKSGGNRLHKDHWRMDGPVGGLGYDPKVDLEIAPGTPGYANNGQKNNLADLKSEIATKVVISEIMYDPGDNGRLAQWIELYNASRVHSVSLKDWKLEIRNRDTDVESYVDSSFKFDSDAIILPNRTLLLVSDRSGASDVPSNRVCNLYQKHRTDLGLLHRRSRLLSSEGFLLLLRDKDNNRVDEVGNVGLDGSRRTVKWQLTEILPAPLGDVRQSIVRQFGTRKRDGTPDAAGPGTLLSAWRRSESVGSFYGHRDDIGSPGHREGSPLPVSLSSFRPVRDAATGAVVIRWTTESELNNAGFNILRSDAKDGEFRVVNVKGLIAGHGTTSEKHTYSYTDTTAKPNVLYYYQIEDVSLDGHRTTLRTTHLRGNVTAGGKLTTVWGDLKFQK